MILSAENLLFLIILIPAISAFIGLYIGMNSEPARNAFYTGTIIIVFALVCFLYPYAKSSSLHYHMAGIMGTGLYLKLDMLRYVMIFLTSFLWLLAHIFSTHYLLKYKHRNRYYMFFILTFSSTLGVFLSEHILNLFTFFELMTVTSYFLVIHDEDEFTHKAGYIYIAMSIAGGLIQLMGIFLLYNYTSTLLINQLPLEIENIGNIKYLIAILIMIGFGVKACMFPLHIWLPKVYPPVPSPATALFSAVLTKTGVFGVFVTLQLMNFDRALSAIVLFIALINMFLGGLLAIHHRNIKKVFAYSSMSQLGYILLGIGLIGLLKDHSRHIYFASVFHMINHGLLKTLLFFGSGVVFMELQKLSLNEIKGFGKNMPFFKFTLAVGFMGTAGIPGFNGFASKTMLHHALYEGTGILNGPFVTFIEVIFFISSAFTAAYLIKIYSALFCEENRAYNSIYKKDVTNKYAIAPMLLLSGMIILIGINPGFLLTILGFSDAYNLHLFTLKNIENALVIAACGYGIYHFYIMKRLRVKTSSDYEYINPTYEWFDLEKNLYVPVLFFLFKVISFILYAFDNILVFIAGKLSSFAKYLFSIEFYRDISYYNRLINLYFKMKTRRLNQKERTRNLFQNSRNNIEGLLNKKEENTRNLIQNSRENIESLIQNEFKVNEDQKINLKRKIQDLSFSLSSITYSIIVFAFILAVLMVSMLII